jgi:ketosteroid isomerase-like protein
MRSPFVTESNTKTDPTKIVELLRRSFLEKDGNLFADLFAEDGVYETRFSLPGAATRFEGREAIRAHLVAQVSDGGAKLMDLQDAHFEVTPSHDGKGFVVEVELEGKSLVNDKPFRFASSIGVVRLNHGEISSYRDYPNALGGAAAAGTLQRLGQYLISIEQ